MLTFDHIFKTYVYVLCDYRIKLTKALPPRLQLYAVFFFDLIIFIAVLLR